MVNPMKFQLRATLLASIAVLALTGCANALNTANESEFACDLATNNCPTPLEVYQATHSTPSSISNGRTPEAWKTGTKEGGRIKKSVSGEELSKDLTQISPSSQLLTALEPSAAPLRQSSQVMRIWVAPWVDSNDNLNWATHIYTEVTPKRWSYGEQEVRHQGMPAAFIPK
jgi:conjugal transfer pilus assembly protein TraV